MTGNRTTNGLLLQPRDLRLLTELAAMRLMDRELAQLAGGFTDCTRRVNARLLKLVRAGLLNRFSIGTVGAGRKSIYALSRKGAALVGSSQRLISRRFGRTLVGDLFVDHQLQINTFYAALKFRTYRDNVSLHAWRTFTEKLTPKVPLIPDGYFELDTPSGIKAHFLEVDMGTETRAVWNRKVSAYLDLARSGEYLRIFAQSQFRVLVLAPSEKRLSNIRGVARRHTDRVFYFATFEDIKRRGMWSQVWFRPTGDQQVPLL